MPSGKTIVPLFWRRAVTTRRVATPIPTMTPRARTVTAEPILIRIKPNRDKADTEIQVAILEKNAT